MTGVRILCEGDREVALAPDGTEVTVTYEYRTIALDSGVRVEGVLVGVHEGSGEVLVVPAQATPRIKAARHATKDLVLEVRIPRELSDVLSLPADHFGVAEKKFSPALVRYYVRRAIETPSLAHRLQRLADSRLATGPLTERVRVRCDPTVSDGLSGLTGVLGTTSRSDVVRGAILVAKEDILDGGSKRRTAELGAIAIAV